MKPCEICSNKSHHKHHLKSKCFGVDNSKYNVAHLCASCHSEVHIGNIILEGRFMTTTGYKLLYHKINDMSITNVEPKCFIHKKSKQLL